MNKPTLFWFNPADEKKQVESNVDTTACFVLQSEFNKLTWLAKNLTAELATYKSQHQFNGYADKALARVEALESRIRELESHLDWILCTLPARVPEWTTAVQLRVGAEYFRGLEERLNAPPPPNTR